MKKVIRYTRNIMLGALGFMALTACESFGVRSASVTHPANIAIEDGCPTSVTPDEIDLTLSRGDKASWQSVDTDGDPVAASYKIYFDPFVGKSLKSNASGFAKSKPVDPTTPKVTFKYTVVVDGCDPLDPRILIL